MNVLISTSVVEEGIDVPSCNLVVKYDFPQTFRSYIQSKGRARKRGSLYILMVEDGDKEKEKEKKYNEWLGVYKMSMEECHLKKVLGLIVNRKVTSWSIFGNFRSVQKLCFNTWSVF